jgi:hypothetical protein
MRTILVDLVLQILLSYKSTDFSEQVRFSGRIISKNSGYFSLGNS